MKSASLFMKSIAKIRLKLDILISTVEKRRMFVTYEVCPLCTVAGHRSPLRGRFTNNNNNMNDGTSCIVIINIIFIENNYCFSKHKLHTLKSTVTL